MCPARSWLEKPATSSASRLPYADGDVLRDLLRAERARTVIEIGLAYGASALAIAAALVAEGHGAARHLIVDPFQDRFQEAGWNALQQAGLSAVCELRRERSQYALPKLLTEGIVADAAFVDGSHTFHNVFVDLYYLRELVRPGGLIVLDDCAWDSVASAARYFEANAGWTSERIPAETRLCAYRLPINWTDPGFEDFKPFGAEGTR